MPIANILSEIDSEISVLLKVKQLLSGSDSSIATRRRGRPVGGGVAKKVSAVLPLVATTQPLRKMSAAGRARISAAMKARWKTVRKAAKKAAIVGATTQKSLVAAALPKSSAKKSASKKATAKKAASKKSPVKKASPAPTNTSA